MLSYNCILAKVRVLYDLEKYYGIEGSRCSRENTLKTLSCLQWLYNNAYDCLDDCQKDTISKYMNAISKQLDQHTCATGTFSCSISIQDLLPTSGCSKINISVIN